MFSQRLLIFIITTGLLSGCMIGPNFQSPASPRVRAYTESPLPRKTVATPRAGKGGVAQKYVINQDISGQWWKLYHSPALNALINRGIANSPNLAAAYATLRQAQEALNVQVGNLLFPAFSAGLTGQRQRFSDQQFGDTGAPIGASIFNLFNASVNVSYTLDIWGKSRRQIEALQAQVDYQQFQLLAAYLTLTSNIVTTAITVASVEEQIKVTHILIKDQQEQLRIVSSQFKYGSVSKANVYLQETLLEQTRATLPPLEKNLAQARHALAVLVGEFPNRKMPRFNLNSITLPRKLPITLPSNLVRQRPDIRAAEALLHAASAQIGVATGNLLPQVTITGYDGWLSTVFSSLFSPTNRIWSIATGITQPIFQGGALLAQRRQSIAAFEQACAQYRQTVLVAFRDVADTLRALETDARALRAQKLAEEAAHNSVRLSEYQYKLGGVDFLTLLNAQIQYQQTKIARIKAQALRYNDTAALFQALGGGWWHRTWCKRTCA